MSNGTYYDPTKLAAALAAQGVGADGRTILDGNSLLSIMNSVAAPTQTAAGGMYTGAVANSNDGGDSGGGAAAAQYYSPATYANGLQDIGYGGTYTSQDDYNQQVAALEQSMGLTPGQQYTFGKYDNPTGNGEKDQAIVYYDANGNPVAANNQYQPSNWVNGGREALIAAGIIGGSAFGAQYLAGAGALAGSGAGAAGAAEAGAGAGAAGAGGGLLDAGATAGAAGGAGAGAGATGAAGAGAGAGGAGALGTGLGYTVPAGYSGLAGLTDAQLAAASAAAGTGAVGSTLATTAGKTLATTATQQALTQGAGTAASSLIPGISNGQLLTTAGGLLGAAAGAVGAGSGLNSATTTNQSTVDPRVAQYVYGADGNSGLLGSVNSLTNSQLATGGLNATQTQGLNQQLAAYNDPAYTAGLQSMRTAGAGLLNAPVASNPFTSGQASLTATSPAGTTSQAMPAGWNPMQTQLNQKPKPTMTGLLGAYGT
ncbi:MAG: hypothetical protein JWQ89_3710 [Devosia sp.]|uniref:hypothetical protein n=1 Tax=Devosia sp. TaxID=1871048 RepID=UPI00260C61C9|nr:hypothetical protein [Devosia sp.]MDB5541983.1 hypothetical protein [Devosia sp.]